MNSQTGCWAVSALLSLLLAPLLPGIINRVKAFFAGRRGPSFFQETPRERWESKPPGLNRELEVC